MAATRDSTPSSSDLEMRNNEHFSSEESESEAARSPIGEKEKQNIPRREWADDVNSINSDEFDGPSGSNGHGYGAPRGRVSAPAGPTKGFVADRKSEAGPRTLGKRRPRSPQIL